MVLVHTRPRRCTIQPTIVFVEVTQTTGTPVAEYVAALGAASLAVVPFAMTYPEAQKFLNRIGSKALIRVEAVPNALVMQQFREAVAAVATDHPGVIIVMHHVGHSERLTATDQAVEEAARLSMYPTRPTGDRA